MPEARAEVVSSEVGRLRKLLLPEKAGHVASVVYEHYIEVLRRGSDGANVLAEFLQALVSEPEAG